MKKLNKMTKPLRERRQKLCGKICVGARHATCRGSGNYLMSGGGGSTFLLQGILAVLVLCKIMRCSATLILDSFVCSSGEKSSDDLHMAIHWCLVEGGPTPLVCQVDLCSCLDQQINHLEVSIPWCMNEWGPTTLISSVDIRPFGNEEFCEENMASFCCTVDVGLMNFRCTH